MRSGPLRDRSKEVELENEVRQVIGQRWDEIMRGNEGSGRRELRKLLSLNEGKALHLNFS